MTSFLLNVRERFKVFSQIPSWFWADILFPFLLLRFVLLICAWFAPYFLPNPPYQKYFNQGYFLTPNVWIDMWSHWDAKWFLSIVTNDYTVPQGFPNVISNLPFFPLFPYLVRLTAALIPAVAQRTNVLLFVGLLISNIAFLTAITLLYKLIKEHLFDQTAAQRTIILVLLFPTSFYMTSFYSEGLYLGLAVCAFYAAAKNRWAVAGLLSGLIAITRFQGILLVFALLWFYMEKRGWDLHKIKPDLLWFVSVPLTLFAYLYHLYAITGNPLALIAAEQPWGKIIPFSFNAYLSLASVTYQKVDSIDLIVFFLFLLLSIIALIKFSSKAYGVFCLASIAMPLGSLNIFAFTRYAACIFPAFILLGYYSKNRYLYYFLVLTSFTLLILFWVGFQNYYWIE